MPYLTNTELKAWLGGGMNSDDDTLLTGLIANAQAYIDAHCRRTFEASGDTTKYFDAETDVVEAEDGSRRQLWLGRHELCAITTVTNGDGEVVASNQYVTEPRNTAPYYALTLKRSADVAWTWEDSPENAISIAGRFAYSTTAPADVKHACTRLAAWLYKQRDTQSDGDRVQIADGVTILPMRLPKDIADILAPYVRLI